MYKTSSTIVTSQLMKVKRQVQLAVTWRGVEAEEEEVDCKTEIKR